MKAEGFARPSAFLAFRHKRMCQRLETLLAAHDQPGELLATPTPGLKATIKLDLDDAPDEAVGQTLGRYKLLERVGEGGCGVVYVAEQTEPVRRRVALKVIKLGCERNRLHTRWPHPGHRRGRRHGQAVGCGHAA